MSIEIHEPLDALSESSDGRIGTLDWSQCPAVESVFGRLGGAWVFRYLTVQTVVEAKDKGWDKLSNGDLLAEAERAGFDILLTAGADIAYQQNLTGRKIAILVLSRNRWRLVQRVIRKIVAAVNDAEPGSYTLIAVPIK